MGPMRSLRLAGCLYEQCNEMIQSHLNFSVHNQIFQGPTLKQFCQVSISDQSALSGQPMPKYCTPANCDSACPSVLSQKNSNNFIIILRPHPLPHFFLQLPYVMNCDYFFFFSFYIDLPFFFFSITCRKVAGPKFSLISQDPSDFHSRGT